MRIVIAASLSCLSVSALSACGDDDVDRVQNKPPVAVATGGGTFAKGSLLTFDASGSTDEDGNIVAQSWDFGDGATGSGVSAQHIYNTAGSYNVVLTVTDDKGDTGEATVAVQIDDNEAPVAVIAGPATGSAGASLRFDGVGSTDSDGTVSAYTWDFGDGTTGAGPIVDHSFADPGAFTVRLTVTDNEGAPSVPAEHSVVVEDGPASLDGQWAWFLTDESLRTLPGLCGTFQDSVLTITTNGTNITITENGGGQMFNYLGTVNPADNSFSCTYDDGLAPQTIAGVFDSATSFTGTYALDLSLLGETCETRPVQGVKQ